MAHADRIPHDRRAGQHPKQVHHLNPLICSRIRHLASAKRPADPVRKFVLCVGGKFTVHTSLSTFWHQNAAPSPQPPTPPSPQTASRSSPPPPLYCAEHFENDDRPHERFDTTRARDSNSTPVLGSLRFTCSILLR